jgi:hypothetical protein
MKKENFMNWTSSNNPSYKNMPDLQNTVGKAGTSDSVIIISAVAWVIRRLLK